jgi:cystathionine gamma-synthase
MSTITLPPQRRTRHAHIAQLPLHHGGTLDDVRIAYECYGDPHLPAVAVLGGISAGRHVLDNDRHTSWWPGVVGAGQALDPHEFRLIGIDFLGGRGGSSRPNTGEQWPALSTFDQAAALAAVLDHLGVERLHAIVGASFGGMIALAFASRYPQRVERVVAVGAAHRSHPLTTAIRSVQRRIVQLGIDSGNREQAIATARALAITTYRSATEFAQRFSGDPALNGGHARFPVDDYLEHHGRQYAESFGAESFLCVSQCLDLHAVDPATIAAHCDLVCFDTDTCVPPADVRALAAALGTKATLTTVSTLHGHDGFLKEPAAVSAVIRRVLQGETPVQATVAGAPPPLQPDGTPATHYSGRASEQSRTRGCATTAARAGIGADTQHGAVIAPIHLSSTFTFNGFEGKRAYDYTRSGNPTRDILAATIAELEKGEAGIVTPTGMAAITVVLQLLKPGDLLIAAHDGYGGTYRLLRALARRHAFEVLLLDLSDARSLDIIRTRRPRMVWLETPSNPLLRITDIQAVANAAHDAGALCVADNTFLSPALQQPITHGADIVVHSTTKYLNGHSDVVGGAVVAREHALAEELGWWANCIGATGAPFDSYLTLRGIRTLSARIRSHEENAHAIVDLLHGHAAVKRVYYPGLKSHPNHELAARQQRGFGAMISFELNGDLRRFLDGLRCFSLAESLGGVESLIAHPATMTHAAMDAEGRRVAGISDELLRLSVGIEDTEDLVADLSEALARGA